MSDSNLNQLRHSTAHLLAAAVLQLYPDTKLTIGPAIENGFYYDFDFKNPISENDFPKIEGKMRDIVKQWRNFEKIESDESDAVKRVGENEYKKELIEEIAKKGEPITFYKSGEFVDLCRGGHVEAPARELKHFKLLSVAGAYWRGSEKNKMLTRIYGTAFPTKEELDEHVKALEEAKKRDHRIIGEKMDLFTISEEVGRGLILWLPKGTVLKEQLENLAKRTEKKYGYQRVSTPHIAKESLYYMSGHLPYYKDDMFPPMVAEDGTYYLKPMNCPFMHLIYKARKHSYKELPIRYAEYGTVYRYEDGGTLMGLMRVRGLTQNDAHIYTTEEHVVDELVAVMEMHAYYFKLLDIKDSDYYVELALPDLENKKDKYFDNPAAWEKSVSLLREAAKKANVKVVEKVGGAAFYGPKFDFNIKSATGREFGASTNQLDFGAGERFGLEYTDSDGAEKTVPYVIHRAPLGSNERYIGFLTEHYAGNFPVWLAPVQVAILPVSEKHIDRAKEILSEFEKNDIRAELDNDNKTLGAKIRTATLQKVPYMVIIGDKEVSRDDLVVTVRTRDGHDEGLQAVSEFMKTLKTSIET